jgi:putative restriction endonuclease
MKFYVGVTDKIWFDNLRYSQSEEVNFWQPGGRTRFRALNEGDLFLFKLHSPHDYIVGGGVFVYSNILPVSLAWRAFGENNGAKSFGEMRRLIESHRGVEPTFADYDIGCIILTQPFFWPEDQWMPVPRDWSRNIVQGKTYNTSSETGKRLWDDVQLRLAGKPEYVREPSKKGNEERYGPERPYRPRLGQGSFRVIVTDAYRRRCAVTQERVLPALEAAHIKPYAESGPHDIGNGVLLRSDLHHLLDAGYVTISPDYHFEVSKRIKEDFDNGEEYRQLHGSRLYLPARQSEYPSVEFIQWHNENKYMR